MSRSSGREKGETASTGTRYISLRKMGDLGPTTAKNVRIQYPGGKGLFFLTGTFRVLPSKILENGSDTILRRKGLDSSKPLCRRQGGPRDWVGTRRKKGFSS